MENSNRVFFDIKNRSNFKLANSTLMQRDRSCDTVKQSFSTNFNDEAKYKDELVSPVRKYNHSS